jgi:uncharacterized phage-like protein YoqJ
MRVSYNESQWRWEGLTKMSELETTGAEKKSEISKKNTCCFTGHRESKLAWGGRESDPRCVALKRKLSDTLEALYTSGVRHFICGMANGCDMYFCEAVIELRNHGSDVTLEAAIPWEGQAERWAPRLRERYSRLLSECDYQTLVQARYTPDCLQRRNCYMVDSSSVLVAAYNGSPGGTRQTMLYAMRQGLQIVEIQLEML